MLYLLALCNLFEREARVLKHPQQRRVVQPFQVDEETGVDGSEFPVIGALTVNDVARNHPNVIEAGTHHLAQYGDPRFCIALDRRDETLKMNKCDLPVFLNEIFEKGFDKLSGARFEVLPLCGTAWWDQRFCDVQYVGKELQIFGIEVIDQIDSMAG